MVAILGNERAIGQIYNISGDRYVSFDGIARACAQAAGKSPEQLSIVHYDPKAFDFGKAKAFPLRMQHFFTEIQKAKTELDWQPSFSLATGLKDSFDQGSTTPGDLDFSLDDQILARA